MSARVCVCASLRNTGRMKPPNHNTVPHHLQHHHYQQQPRIVRAP